MVIVYPERRDRNDVLWGCGSCCVFLRHLALLISDMQSKLAGDVHSLRLQVL